MPEQAYSLLLTSIYATLGKPVLFVTAHPEVARRRFDQMKMWVSHADYIYFFPEVDILGGKIATDSSITSERLKILSLFTAADGDVCKNNIRPFILTSALSLANRSISRQDFQSSCYQIEKGMTIPPIKMLEKFQSLGYRYDEVIEVPGTFARRGGIIDIFPGDSKFPVRIEFLGNEIDGIRQYDPKTQRSSIQLRSLLIPPVEDTSHSGEANLLDYLPAETLIIMDDCLQIETEIQNIEDEIEKITGSGAVDENGVGDLATCFSWQEIAQKIDRFSDVIELGLWGANVSTGTINYTVLVKPASSYSARFQTFLDHLAELRVEYKRLVIVSQQADRISELLRERNIDVYPQEALKQTQQEGALVLIRGSLDGGFQITNKFLLLTDLELFGIIKQRRAVKTRPVRHHWFHNDINVGDLVVHVEHGIGRFAGTTKMVNGGVQKEYLVLEYAGSDTLYVPVDQVDRVNLYIGGGERVPALSHLGTQEWNRTRKKVKESVADIAKELIELYAAREASSGLAFSTDTLWQQELEASFPYVETADQVEAVNAVKEDMESAKPMDRLVCGDVGYGKTEVALRAAFKAVMDNRQVAVLVPTTILAQQHINTFGERLKPFPVKIAMLSRFCTPKQQADVIYKLADGSIDICIGTHRLLQKDVVFKDLGLVIIDEEQRFGVGHKEHLKKMRQTADVLTLSATPIPRTLHMSLSGIRDMSTIETPPEDRLPVNTYVGEFSERLVRETILREMERDGQVFVVHNRVQSINIMAQKIANLVPEARITIAHGQMDEEKLERVMADFIQGKSDILVTTTIIESGLDMPNVNTLIVNGADKLGLTQLYQLRGRIGRGANTAYAYFLFDSGKDLTDQARERLKTIAQATELGAGFAIAMKDLEIRGAGNLLGAEQSGHIATVGFNYYCQLLSDAVEGLRAKREGRETRVKADTSGVSIDLRIPAFIPEDYVENTRTRFNIYRRLTDVAGVQQIKDLGEELRDRFGKIPEEVSNLLYVVELKLVAIRAGVESIFRDEDEIIISFRGPVGISRRSPIIEKKIDVKVGNRQVRIDIDALGDAWKDLLKELLDEIADISSFR